MGKTLAKEQRNVSARQQGWAPQPWGGAQLRAVLSLRSWREPFPVCRDGALSKVTHSP